MGMTGIFGTISGAVNSFTALAIVRLDNGNGVGVTVVNQDHVRTVDSDDDSALDGPVPRSKFFSPVEKQTFDNWVTRDNEEWRGIPESLRSKTSQYWKQALTDWKTPMFVVMRV
ncbi:hypothetical protein ABW19_dt0206961 [Dactylella cylindrospora]|nr:hypothetical protein ABW19_dt0206961 [Dactylella cylindrospora]